MLQARFAQVVTEVGKDALWRFVRDRFMESSLCKDVPTGQARPLKSLEFP